jgi:hypothetical protein
MAIANLADVVNCYTEGREKYAYFRKVPVQATTAGTWFDLSMSPGNPVAQYYAAAPLVSKALYKSDGVGISGSGGIDHGGDVAPRSKYLRRMMVMSAVAGQVPMVLYLCDYLLYYPFIDEGFGSSLQSMTQVDTLPRYTTGEGVQMMAVIVAAHGFAADTFTVTYINEHGVEHTTPLVAMNTANSATGSILTSQTTLTRANGPFLPLAAGDSGVRSITGVTLTSGIDTGLFTLVLVKPLATLSLRGVDAPVEVDYLTDAGIQLPRVYDNAYLNFVVHPAGAIAGQLLGDATFIWD